MVYIQWGEQVFDTLPILQVFLLTKHVEVCNFYQRYTSTVRDGQKCTKNTENHIMIFKSLICILLHDISI